MELEPHPRNVKLMSDLKLSLSEYQRNRNNNQLRYNLLQLPAWQLVQHFSTRIEDNNEPHAVRIMRSTLVAADI